MRALSYIVVVAIVIRDLLPLGRLLFLSLWLLVHSRCRFLDEANQGSRALRDRKLEEVGAPVDHQVLLVGQMEKADKAEWHRDIFGLVWRVPIFFFLNKDFYLFIKNIYRDCVQLGERLDDLGKLQRASDLVTRLRWLLWGDGCGCRYSGQLLPQIVLELFHVHTLGGLCKANVNLLDRLGPGDHIGAARNKNNKKLD